MGYDTPFLSQIHIFSFNFAPKGWAMCNGQLLPINENEALFALLGTTYGGDGRVNFALPNLQGRVPIHMGNSHTLGERGGEYAHTVTINEMPAHSHGIQAGATVNSNTPLNNLWAANTGFSPYSNVPNENMYAGLIANTGGSQAHQNESPYLVLNFSIALEGIFPSQT